MGDIHEFIKARKNLIWWIRDYDTLDAEAIVEATLNNGDWDDVKALLKILTIEKVAEIFRAKSTQSPLGRQNYSPKTKAYFTAFFDRYAPRNFDRGTS